MSVRLYRYDPKYCEGKPCIGDCDLCRDWEDFEEYEDGEDEDERD